MQREAKEKLKEKNIRWTEGYTDKTAFLKEQFEAVIGPGSYFRFEGLNRDNGDEYYVIIGPANIHKPRAKFFAGVRKLPAEYSAAGLYFDSMDRAAEYARETWGVMPPDELRPYTSGQLHGIAGKIEKWKKEREAAEENGEDKSNDVKETEENKVKKASSGDSFNLCRFKKIAMGTQWQSSSKGGREAYH